MTNANVTGVLTAAAAPTAQQILLMSLKERLKLYVEAMAPGKPIQEKEGAAQQAALWNTILFVLERKGSEFVLLYAELLATVQLHRQGVFNERHLYRFHDALTLSSDKIRNFRRILHLLLTTCDPKSKSTFLKQISFPTLLAGFADSDMQQRIVGFYDV